MYKWILKPFFFLFSPEKAHYMAMDLLRIACKFSFGAAIVRSLFSIRNQQLERTVAGLKFPNPVGLAAGFDKDARWVDVLANLGFGSVEIGTLTPKSQGGNEKPRLFRLPIDRALINRMGFNNQGVDAAVERLKRRKSTIIVGGNIGKNKVTPNEQAVDDYVYCFNALFDVVDYFVVNVSSPNTPGLRELQDKEPLTALLTTLQQRNALKPHPKPIFLKIAPDLTNAQLDDIVSIVKESKIAGVIATNTTIDRSMLKTDEKVVTEIGAGGLSGAPVRERSTDVIRYLHEKSANAFPIIGVGGIETGKDAQEKMDAGADLIQVYTGFIYQGPAIAKKINHHLLQ